MFATLSAGPIYLALIAIGATLHDPGSIDIASVLTYLPFAVVGGVMLGVVPIALGGWMMRSLAANTDWGRHPLAWAIAGAMIGALVALIMYGIGLWQIAVAFGLTGAICALIGRYATRWDDDASV